jgi:hypothetical protein
MMSKPDPSAKRRAQNYQQQQEPTGIDPQTDQQRQVERPHIHNEQDFIDLVGRRIEEAMRNGAFDNLRGKGKPLNLERNPFIPEGMELAYSIMQNNHIAPEWISDRAAILHRIKTFRKEIKAAVACYQSQLQQTTDAVAHEQIDQAWRSQLAELATQLSQLNRQIGLINLKQPLIQLEIFKLRLDEELARAGLASARG